MDRNENVEEYHVLVSLVTIGLTGYIKVQKIGGYCLSIFVFWAIGSETTSILSPEFFEMFQNSGADYFWSAVNLNFWGYSFSKGCCSKTGLTF